MKNKKIVVRLLVMLVVAMSTFTFAYWASSVNGNVDTATGTVTIGSGSAVSTTVTVGDVTNAGELVPAGMAAYSSGSPVEYVMLSFSVAWTEAVGLADGTVSTLSFAESNVLIDGLATYAGSVNISYQIGGTVTGSTFNADGSTDITLNGDSVTVFVLVTLDEPADITEYTAVAGADITFTGTFTVA